MAKSQKSLSVRMDEEDYQFLNRLAKEEKEGVSKALRKVMSLGRVMLAVKKYKKSEVSLGKATEIAGVSISDMIEILADYGIESKLDFEDYRQGLENLRKIW